MKHNKVKLLTKYNTKLSTKIIYKAEKIIVKLKGLRFAISAIYYNKRKNYQVAKVAGSRTSEFKAKILKLNIDYLTLKK